MKQCATAIDLHDYDSTIKRADGQVPFNGYLWPTESWWPCHSDEFRNVSNRWHFGIVPLSDGRFSVDGAVCQIERNSDIPFLSPGASEGLPVVFATRHEAIRTAAARMIRSMLASRFDSFPQFSFDHMSRELMIAVINWTRAKVAEACQAATPDPISLAPMPVIKDLVANPLAGLPLFERSKT